MFMIIHLGSSWPQVPILHRSTSRQISWSYPINGLLLNLLNNVALLVFVLTPARHHISMRLTSLSGLPEGCVSPPCGFEQIESCSLYHFSKASAGRPTWQWEFPTYQYFLEVIQQQGKIIEISEISVLFYSPSSPGDKKLEGKTLASSSLCQESTWKCRRGRLGRMLCLKTLWLDSLYHES